MNRMLLQFSYASSTLHVIPSSSDVPKSLRSVTAIESPVAYCIRHLNSILQDPPDLRFAFQRKIDQGNVVDWPIELLHPTKCNLKIDRMFYEELVEFVRIHMMQKYIYILGWMSMIMCTLQSLTPLIEDQLLKQCLYLKKIMNCIHTMVAFSKSASH